MKSIKIISSSTTTLSWKGEPITNAFWWKDEIIGKLYIILFVLDVNMFDNVQQVLGYITFINNMLNGGQSSTYFY
jgi:hypothetical protein